MINELLVRDAMTRTVLTVRADATLRELQALIGRYGLDVIPVVTRDETGGWRTLAGIATRGDLLQALLEAKTIRGLQARWARTVATLTRVVPPLRPSESLTTAAKRMVSDSLAALPVADGKGRVVGVLSLADVLDRTGRTRDFHAV